MEEREERPGLFTKANAREMGKRSVQAKAVRLANLEAELARELARPRMPETVTITEPLNGRVKRVGFQIERINRLIERTNNGKELAALVQALDRLYGIWCLLTGFERPGIRKPRKTRTVPVQPEPEPAQHVQPDQVPN